MDSSFYYFFSATPQVLAGILALFGVFVIFKIQSIRSELFGIGQAIYDDVIKNVDSTILADRLSDKEDNKTILGRIKKTLNRKDIESLTSIFKLIKEHGIYAPYVSSYFQFHDSLQTIIRETIIWSILTAGIIIFCLIIIPFGHIILDHLCLLYTSILITISGVLICFYGFISILKKSLTYPDLQNI